MELDERFPWGEHTQEVYEKQAATRAVDRGAGNFGRSGIPGGTRSVNERQRGTAGSVANSANDHRSYRRRREQANRKRQRLRENRRRSQSLEGQEDGIERKNKSERRGAHSRCANGKSTDT